MRDSDAILLVIGASSRQASPSASSAARTTCRLWSLSASRNGWQPCVLTPRLVQARTPSSLTIVRRVGQRAANVADALLVVYGGRRARQRQHRKPAHLGSSLREHDLEGVRIDAGAADKRREGVALLICAASDSMVRATRLNCSDRLVVERRDLSPQTRQRFEPSRGADVRGIPDLRKGLLEHLAKERLHGS